MKQRELIDEALRLRPSAIPYYVTQQLATLFPDKVITESNDYFFQVEEYSKDGQCTITHLTNQDNEVLAHWYHTDYDSSAGEYIERYLYKRVYNAWLEITWHATTFTLLTLHWELLEGHTSVRYWLLADTEQQANQFMGEVCRWNAEIRDAILVFNDGCWEKEKRLFQTIKNPSLGTSLLVG